MDYVVDVACRQLVCLATARTRHGRDKPVPCSVASPSLPRIPNPEYMGTLAPWGMRLHMPDP